VADDGGVGEDLVAAAVIEVAVGVDHPADVATAELGGDAGSCSSCHGGRETGVDDDEPGGCIDDAGRDRRCLESGAEAGDAVGGMGDPVEGFFVFLTDRRDRRRQGDEDAWHEGGLHETSMKAPRFSLPMCGVDGRLRQTRSLKDLA
jgi:hypothetical protein